MRMINLRGKKKELVTLDLEGYGLEVWERDCMMVVKEIVGRLLEEEEKLEWWFEQDIDKEEERFEGDEDGVITEYLVNISKRRAFWSLNEDILKITILTTNTPYPSRKIRCICACTHQIPQRKPVQYAVSSEAQYAVLEI
ncbi:hypothetical protein Tco_1401154 [Tanacetum coccineum]